MRKIFFLVALLSASIMSFAAGEVNFALATEGSSASASSGDAALAIDGNNGTRWESAQTDAEWFLLDLGQSRTFNYIKILWEPPTFSSKDPSMRERILNNLKKVDYYSMNLDEAVDLVKFAFEHANPGVFDIMNFL